MGPRKKAKKGTTEAAASSHDTNPPPHPTASTGPNTAESSQEINSNAVDTSEVAQPSTPSRAPSTKSAKTVTLPITDTDQSSVKSASWYGGSWRSKAPAMTKIDKDSHVVADRPRLESSQSDKPVPPSPTRYMSHGSRRSSKTIPLAASTTKVNATSSGSSDTRLQEGRAPEKTAEEPPLPPDPTPGKDSKEAAVANGAADANAGQKEAQKAATSTWRGWWSRPDNPPTDNVKEKAAGDELRKDKEVAKKTPLPESPEATKKPDPMAIAGRVQAPQFSGASTPKDGASDVANAANQNRSSWFWLWSRQQNAQNEQAAPQAQDKGEQGPPEPTLEQPEAPPAVQVTSASEPTTPGEVQASTKDAAAKSTGWAFWSKDKPKSDAASDAGSTHKQVGELAVADTPSQSHPEAAQFNEHEETAAKKEPAKSAKSIRGRKKLKESDSTSKPSTPTVATPVKGTPSGSPTRKDKEPSKQQEISIPPQPAAKDKLQAQAAQLIAKQNNILLPQFDTTYSTAQNTSYWEQLRRLFWNASPEAPRLHLDPHPPRIHRALAIGVHGFFPAATFRFVLGQPTGTSIRFANQAAAAIKEWVAQHGDYECEIDKAALEGEGFIADRVDTLWKLLLNWIDKIRKADFIMVAAHSQGVPVAIMLVAKLIQFGCVSPNARIGICAMAGVNMGPFVEYKTSLFGSTATELFEFSRPDSKVSLMYEKALDIVLGHGVRISYIGSIDDQLVSLEVC